MIERIIRQAGWYRRMLSGLSAGRGAVSVTGLSNPHKAIVLAAAAEAGPLLVIVPDEAAGTRMAEDLCALLGEDAALLYPSREFTFRDVEGVSREYEQTRLGVLGQVAEGRCRIVVAGVEAALQYTIPPDVLRENTLTLRAGEEYDLAQLEERFVKSGYERRDQVDGRCQFSVRGGILDFFSPQSASPFRVEFWGNEIDTISAFDPDTQRRTDTVKSADITPAREVLFPSAPWLLKRMGKAHDALRGKQGVLAKEHLLSDMEKLENGLALPNIDKYLPLIFDTPATLFDYFPGGVTVLCEAVTAKETAKNAMVQFYEDVTLMMEEGILFKGCSTYTMDFPVLLARAAAGKCLLLDSFARSLPELPLSDLIPVSAVGLSSWSGDLKLLKEDLDGYLRGGYCCAVLAGTDKAADTLADDLTDAGLRAIRTGDVKTAVPGVVYVLEGSLSGGLELPEEKFVLITYLKTAQRKTVRRKKKKAGEEIRSLTDLTPGDLVVHAAHGIGVFQGIIKREIHGVTKDYIQIRYAGTDALFVPVTQLDLVSKYIGARDDSSVKLSRLNSVEWQKTRQRVKKAVAEMAEDLIRLYAERMKVKGHAFAPDTEWQKEFEERFPYQETDDQLRCIAEMKADMESERPMDRLLCGDVGFGKTEVALRGAFKCVMDGRQCAVLVPTTILAWQHYQTFLNRLQGFPVTVELLSRFRTPKQQEAILRRLRRGEVDIVVGTHRLLQKDVQFKDLGLCIIDEEQRFGVAHKEKFKEFRNSVDVLTLSATPIPRTLNMAMSGIRDMSTIEEAPGDRHPVQTYVIEHDDGVVLEAIRRELRRGGQVFYLHNRVESIDSCAYHLQKALPDARIVTAHGKMGEEQLSEIWQQLIDHEIDVLVCTTIIETGVDVSNCNTLIIEDADRLGLSQLYQIRGRVGRSNRRAFAYFTFRPGKALTEVAAKRLAAIREFTNFGSGFRIAMRDLEIRGAGNILGTSQHGHMEAVGYEMYLKLLSEAVAEQRGESTVSSAECQVDIRIGAHIPEDYIENLSQRIEIYKKIATIQNEEDAWDVTDELIDRFGEPPESVKGLIDVALLRNIAASLGIYEISQKNDVIVFYLTTLDLEKVGRLSAGLKNRVSINASAKPYVSVRGMAGEDPVHTMRTALYLMSRESPKGENAREEH
ncbi:MAG: transcription-repair coupling factor [Oscillospiraceae bacterium]|nr:transcription-repair coupling factor [Oscillospiraceae bacterium]